MPARELSASSVAPDPRWAEPDLGPRWRRQFMHWVIRAGGRARAYHLAFFATVWYVLFYPSVRRRCRYYLNLRFPLRTRWYQRLLDDHRLIRSYAATLVDIVVLSALGPKAISASCPQHDELIQRCALPEGFVLVHAHVGCFQIGMSALTQFPKPVSIVTIPEPGTKPPGQVIDPRSGVAGVIQMTEALLRGEIVAIMGDRTFGADHNAVAVDFLGRKALFPISPYRIASATGAPVLVMTAPKTGKTTYELRVSKIIPVPPGLGRDPAAYAPYAQQFADCIAQFAQDFPWQVFNFYDLWTTTGQEQRPTAPREI